MNKNILTILQDPETKETLSLINPIYENDRVKSGALQSNTQQSEYKIKDFIPRFVTNEQYATSFGREWHFFRRTQLDSHTGTSISRDRWTEITGYKPEDMKGKTVLEAGCGAGRWIEIIAPYAKQCFALDLSIAVEAARENTIDRFKNIDFIQADLNNIPISKESIDFVYSIGVLHHIPDTFKGIKSILTTVKPGGELALWLYGPHFPITPGDIYRLIGSRINPETLLKILQIYVPFALKTHKIPLLGKFFKWVLFPAPSYPNIPIPEDLRLEWSILDAFDRFATRIEKHYTEKELKKMLTEAGLINIRRGKIYNSFIGQKPF